MLDKQIHLYSVDTGHFYSNREKNLHNKNHKYRKEKVFVTERLSALEKNLLKSGYSREDMKHLKKAVSQTPTGTNEPDTLPKTNTEKITDDFGSLLNEFVFWSRILAHKQEKAKQSKEKLLRIFSNKINQNEQSGGKDHLRCIRENELNDNTIISVFDSALTRAIGIEQDELSDSLIIVQVYYFDVFKDSAFYGFTYKGERYRYFTSSAGQIRKKKAVFIKESVWQRIRPTIMCGLTIDKINAKGGNNVNKHLAYMALASSATDVWKDFDIDKTIIIDDFETKVLGTFDFIDETDYSITRKTDYVPIPHTDGAGMILPSLSDKNFMFRAPWIKGLLGVFDFKRFIEVHGSSPIITDIYGKKHDILAEDIQFIFTKSQFKMYKYYDSWNEYKAYFKQYQCTAGICNTEEERIKYAKLNYQMLQTLTDITEDEIDKLTQKSADRIKGICESKETMMEALGITPYNTNMTPFQKAVKLYPALLSDTYTKDILRDVKDSLLKKYRSGKLEITGKYTFILPDFYAACEYWFGHNPTPDGLLNDQEVFCQLFFRNETLDCLRSPHLYREHAIRKNTAHSSYGERAEKIREWFPTNGLYTSAHDLISKLLMFDVDGDKSLVVADSDFIAIAERNMKGIAPLYYNMQKAKAVPLNNQTIYAGLNAAFTGGNIGTYSNHISKIWNHDVFVNGSLSEQQEAINAIKLLCCENNFVIDYAKTLYKPVRPEDKNALISQYTQSKLPAFFTYAKDKETSQVEKRNNSFVNKIYDKIPNQTINTHNVCLEQIDYRKLMKHADMKCPREVSALYDKLNRQYRHMIHMKDEQADNLRYVACQIRKLFHDTGYSDETIADMLVEYLYGQEKRYKQLLWFCYGKIITDNLYTNIKPRKTKYISCIDCGEWIEVDVNNVKTVRCPQCSKAHNRQLKRIQQRNYREKNKRIT